MYDTVILIGKCPNCGKVEEREYQVKDFCNELDIYKEGDYVKDKLTYAQAVFCKCLEAWSRCHNSECAFIGNIEDILWQGTPSGFDFVWKCKIKLDDEWKITNEIYDIDIKTKIPGNWEELIKYRYGDYWNFLIDKYKDKIEAADKFGSRKNQRRFITLVRKMDYARLTCSEIRELLRNEEYRKEEAIRIRAGCELDGCCGYD